MKVQPWLWVSCQHNLDIEVMHDSNALYTAFIANQIYKKRASLNKSIELTEQEVNRNHKREI